MPEASPEPTTQIPALLFFEPSEEQVVEITYPIPGTDPEVPDRASGRIAVKYLRSRHEDDPIPERRHLVLENIPVPFIGYVPTGKEVTRISNEKEPGWWIHPAVTIAGLAISVAAINGPPAAEAVHAIVQRAEYRPTPPRDFTVKTRSKTLTITEQVASPDRVGSFAVDGAAIGRFHVLVEDAVAAGDEVTALDVQANTSDEFAGNGGDNSIAEPSPGNVALDDERAAAVTKRLDHVFHGHLPAPIRETGAEHVIPRGLKARMERLARQAGFPDLIAAVEDADSGESIAGQLGSDIKDDFTDKRGVDVTAAVTVPGHEVTRTGHVKGRDNPPPGPKGWIPWAVTVPPVRRRKLVTETVPDGRWAVVPGFSIPCIPRIVKEDAEHVWVRLLKEVELPDGTLQRHPWAYSRKYLDIFRDRRASLVMRGDFKAPDGSDKSLETLFIDHTPKVEVIALLEEEMRKFAAVQDGRLADLLTIVIHPSSQAGRSPDRPWRIGPGIDKQYGKGTLGVCTPILGLVEIHMETDDLEGLRATLQDFRKSAVITLDHEAAGHGSSIVDEPLTIRRAFNWRYRHARVPAGDPWRHDFALLSAVHKPLVNLRDREALIKQLDELEFDITYRDDGDQLQTARVNARDPLLARSETITMVDTQITQYSGTSDLEYAAETVAAGLSGQAVPMTEVGIRLPKPSGDQEVSYATGYQPDPAALEAAAKLIGGVVGTDPIEFEEMPEVQFTLTYPEQDPVMAELAALARGIRFPKARNMIAILSGVAKHEAHSVSAKNKLV